MGRKDEVKLDVKLEIGISKRRVSDLLCSALEGGSNYWYFIEEFIEPPVVEKHTGMDEVFRHLDYPLSEGGALLISDRKGCVVDEDIRTERLDWPAILKGLAVMAEKHPRHFGNWLSENDDAETGDVFLQCCLYGDTIYA